MTKIGDGYRVTVVPYTEVPLGEDCSNAEASSRQDGTQIASIVVPVVVVVLLLLLLLVGVITGVYLRYRRRRNRSTVTFPDVEFKVLHDT